MKRNNKKYLIIAFFVILFLVLNLWWLSLQLTLFVFVYFFSLKLIKGIRYLILKKILKGIFLFIFAFSVTIGVRMFAFTIYKIPSTSMRNTLFTGDIILVNKLKYGPRLPRSPFDVPWVNIAFYFNANAKKKINEQWWPYKRYSGTTTVKQGDVLVFNLGLSRDFFVVKRCLGIAGDTLQIKDAEIYTNNILYVSPQGIKNNYKFIIQDRKHLYKALDSLSHTPITLQRTKENDFTHTSLSIAELRQLQKLKSLHSLQMVIDTFNIEKKIFPNFPNTKWTLDNMGPILIPKKGMEITFNPKTYLLYKSILKDYENCIITESKKGYFLNGNKVTSYTFKQNYYFVLGDDRKGTMDSRTWGFLPEQNIVGKVQCVLWSKFQDKFQWNRLFKPLD